MLAQHVLGTTMPIIRNSRVLIQWLLPVVFGYVSGLQDASESCRPDTQPSAVHQINNLKTTAPDTIKTSVVSSGHFISTCSGVSESMYLWNLVLTSCYCCFESHIIAYHLTGKRKCNILITGHMFVYQKDVAILESKYTHLDV